MVLMNVRNFLLCIVFALSLSCATAQKVDSVLKQKLEPVYKTWRSAMVSKNHQLWKSVTAKSRMITIYNRINSEKRPYPASIYKVPVAPPGITNLKAVNVNEKGNTAIATYYGKINFGVGGEPTNNLMLLHFVKEAGAWKFDKAEYVNLAALPEIRGQMLRGDFSYAAQKDFVASGVAPTVPKIITSVGYIAKVYVFCPGREVKIDINDGRSKHRFQNDKSAETIIAGAKDGKNKISFTTKTLPGAKGNESLNIRVFLMSQIPGVKPVEVYDYSVTVDQAKAGKKPLAKAYTAFHVKADHVKKIMTKEPR